MTRQLIRRDGDVFIGKKVRITAVGLSIEGDLTKNEWSNVGQILGRLEGSLSWAIGDWANGFELQHPDHWGSCSEEFANDLGLSRQRINQCKSVCGLYSLETRVSKASFKHHLLLVTDDYTAAKRQEWLKRAVEEGWSVAILKRELLETKRLKNLGDGDVFVKQADALEFLERIEDRSVDLLLTDPPYSTDVEDIVAFASSWVPLALSKIAPSGRAYIFTGSYPHEMKAYLDVLLKEEFMNLGKILVWTYRNTLGPSPSKEYKLNWQACWNLYGPNAPPLSCDVMVDQFTVQDVTAPDGRHGDHYHKWQKPIELAERFISHATEQDALVIDPFCGTGTFILAAKHLNRRAIGSDSDCEMMAICKKRGLKVSNDA